MQRFADMSKTHRTQITHHTLDKSHASLQYQARQSLVNIITMLINIFDNGVNFA